MLKNGIKETIFLEKAKRETTRVGFGEGLLLAGEKNRQVVALSADLCESTQVEKFKIRFPESYIEVGVAEQNLVGVAAGLAHLGKIPFAASYAVFSPGRTWEQIRTTICYNNQNVKIVGSHSGLTVGSDGATHQALEDIALMRVLPNMTVLSPCDYLEARRLTLLAAEWQGPTYIRLDRDKTPLITTLDTHCKIGQAETFWAPENNQKATVAILATGPIVYKALIAAKELLKGKIEVEVINFSTVKPLDETTLIRIGKNIGKVVTVENHQKAGGFGSAVSEFYSQYLPIPMEILGINDQFGQSGTAEELLEYYGLGAKDIIAAVKRILNR